jgi:hypothetical protein
MGSVRGVAPLVTEPQHIGGGHRARVIRSLFCNPA